MPLHGSPSHRWIEPFFVAAPITVIAQVEATVPQEIAFLIDRGGIRFARPCSRVCAVLGVEFAQGGQYALIIEEG